MLQASSPHATAETRIADRRADTRPLAVALLQPQGGTITPPAGAGLVPIAAPRIALGPLDHLREVARRNSFAGSLIDEEDGELLTADQLRTRTPLGRRLVRAGLPWDRAAWLIYSVECCPVGLARLKVTVERLERESKALLAAAVARLDARSLDSLPQPARERGLEA